MGNLSRKEKMNIIEFISVGVENAISMEELSLITGLNKRAVRSAVLHARRSGVPICSGENGYWICRDAKEALRYYNAQLGRIISGKSALKPICDFIKREASRAEWEEFDALERAFDEAELLIAAERNTNEHND